MLRRLGIVVVGSLVACSDGTTGVRTLPRVGLGAEAGTPRDFGPADAAVADAVESDLAVPDMARAPDVPFERDMALEVDAGEDLDVGAPDGPRTLDMAPTPDVAAPADVGRRPDVAPDGPILELDMAVPDMAPPVPDMAPDMPPPVPDMAPDIPPPVPDMAPPVPDLGGVPPGRTPCAQGPGWSLFRFHWRGDGSRSPAVDVWDAPCDYSIRINDACGVFARCVGAIPCQTDFVDRNTAVVIDGREDILVRFTVAGLRFDSATLHVQGRSLGGATLFSATSPANGGVQAGPMAGGFEHLWYSVDWSQFVRPGDDPRFTALDLDAVNGRLGIASVELCLDSR